ncbi:hypothetical protein IAQ61_008721 [Plenodomus lingam]|uniref:uncharacterized protein n=1 Tax=Leptosphaeria maculans TaxID=5022 RepID=UPI003316A46E|nr:hypothetical protein IAQ61_008721 [Plenodomus lingam]
MLSKVFITVGLTATVAAFDCNGHYFSFFNRGGNAMSYQRLDPALYPGTESPHLHSFDGGNALSASTDFAETQTSTCSTARIKPDKSLYWRPSIFWNGNGTGFHRVPEKSTKIYYKFGDGDKWANVTGFPENFNMMAGNPLKRSDGENPAGVRWGCHNPDGGSTAIFSNGFPKGFSSCDYGLASEVTFPSCWNGDKLDPENPQAHMAYPSGFSGVGVENCPATHRAARFPTIFVEFWYDVSSFNGQYGPDETPWVVSNGDPTGFGFHADFLNGWEKGVLEKAIGETGGCNCGCGCGQTEMEQCFGAENVNRDADGEFESCAAMTAMGNDATPVLDTLPGCNPLQSGPADATTVTGPNCDATAKPVSPGEKPTSSSSAAAASKTGSLTAKPSTTLDVTDSPPAVEKDDNDNEDANTTPSAVPSRENTSKKANPTTIPSSSSSTATPPPSNPSPTPLTPLPSTNDCKPPISITITPTVYITLAAESEASSSCAQQDTVYATVTETTTVTMSA